MRQDLTCWLQGLPRHDGRSMIIMQWDIVIESNALMLGWGASLNNTSKGGSWTPQERSHHINYLKLLAAFLALKTFATNTHKAILLRLDNVTAIAFLNRMWGDAFRDTLQSGSTHLEMVLGEEYIHPCRTLSQEAECQSRLALAAHTELQQLAAKPPDLPTTSRQAGSFLNRPLCVMHKCSALNLLQLETGSISNSSRCPVNLMER